MRYIHGTTLEAGLSILKKGFQDNNIWNCSEKNQTYMVREDYNDDTLDESDMQYNEAVRFAISSAQIAAAATGTEDTNLILFILNIPEALESSYVYDDDSSDYMYGCYKINNHWLNQFLKSGVITYTTYLCVDAYNSCMRTFYLASLGNDQIDFNIEPMIGYTIRELSRKGVDLCWFAEEYIGVAESICKINPETFTMYTTKSAKIRRILDEANDQGIVDLDEHYTDGGQILIPVLDLKKILEDLL